MKEASVERRKMPFAKVRAALERLGAPQDAGGEAERIRNGAGKERVAFRTEPHPGGIKHGK